jgi:hypothetical protein
MVLIKMHCLTVAPLLGLLVYSANAAHIPSAKQLGDITLLAQNNLRSKLQPNTTLRGTQCHLAIQDPSDIIGLESWADAIPSKRLKQDQRSVIAELEEVI